MKDVEKTGVDEDRVRGTERVGERQSMRLRGRQREGERDRGEERVEAVEGNVRR